MTVTTREAATFKTGGYVVVIQGVPAWFTTGKLALGLGTVVPLTSNQNDVWNTLRAKSATNVIESNAVPIYDTLLAERAVEIGGQELDVLAGEYSVGSLSAQLTLDAVNAPLFAWRARPLGIITTAQVDMNGGTGLVAWELNGDVTSQFTSGQFVYAGQETFRLTASPSYSGVTGLTTLTMQRGQCGSVRDALAAQTPVYGAPPFWRGRRVAVLRAFSDAPEEGEYEVIWTGTIDRAQPSGSLSVTIEAVDLLSDAGVEIRVPLFGLYESATLAGITPRDSAETFGTLHLTIDAVPLTPEDPPAVGSLTIGNGLEYVQIDREVIAVDVTAPTQTTTGPVELLVPPESRNAFGIGEPLTGRDDTGAVTVSDDAAGADVHQLFVATGHPITVAARLIQGGAAGATFAHYDYGAGLGDGLVDVAAFQVAESVAVPDIRIIAGVDGASWSPLVYAQRAAAHAGYLIVPDTSGRITCRQVGYRRNPAVDPSTIEQSDIVLKAGNQPLRIEASWGFDRAVGAVEVALQADPLDDNAPRDTVTIRSAEHAQYAAAGRVAVGIVESDTRVAKLDAAFFPVTDAAPLGANEAEIVAARADAIFARHGRPAAVLTIPCRLSVRRYGIGEIVSVDLSDLPVHDPATGGRYELGVEFVEIIGIALNVPEGYLVLTGYLLNDEVGRFGVIAASGLVESYDGATRAVVFEDNIFATADNALGFREAGHFPVGLRVRAFDPSSATWRSGEGEVFSYNQSTNTVVLTSSPAPPTGLAAGDIVEISEWPTSRDITRARVMVHMAEGGQLYGGDDDTVDGTEALPQAYPYAAGDDYDDPFTLE